MTTLISSLLTATTLSGLAGLAIAGIVPVEPVQARRDGFDCVAFVQQPRGGTVFMLCSDTALSLAWREI